MGEGNVVAQKQLIAKKLRCLNQYYDNMSDDLVLEAKKLFFNTNSLKESAKKQFSDVLEASLQSSGIEEFKLYILYKTTKSGTEKMWKENRLGDKLLESINTICRFEIVSEIRKKTELTSEEYTDKRIKLDILRRFMGYVMWQGNIEVAKNKAKNDQK
jgi:uncharacterized protein YutD